MLDRYNVEVIGVKTDAIERGEDRIAFKETMAKLGISVPKSEACNTVEDAVRIAGELQCPVVVRPAYTLGGTGGGIAYNLDEVKTISERGLSVSLIHQVLIEESVIGWEELELEVVRDAKNQIITVCFIENVTPWGSIPATASALRPCSRCPWRSRSGLRKSPTGSSRPSVSSGGRTSSSRTTRPTAVSW